MNDFNGKQHRIWIFICIFGCVVTDGKALICNQHGHEHSRTLDDENRTTDVKHPRELNIEVDPNGLNVITDHVICKEVNDNVVTADKQVIYDVNNDIDIQFNNEALPAGQYIIEHPYYKDGKNQEHQNYINSFNTNDHQYNYNQNRGEENPQLYGITTIDLAGYDDQIINLMNDIQKQGVGREVLVYFYLFINNNFRNIGNFYTNKNILRDCITKYTHYFCVGHNRNDCSCLLNVKSNDKPIVQVNPKVENVELNKIDHIGSISGQEFNIKLDANKIHNINVTTSEFKVKSSEKQSTGIYEFTPPGEKDSKLKDVFVDVLHSKPSEVIAENKIGQSLYNVNNDAAHQVEIEKNIVSGNNVASFLPKLNQQNINDLQGISDVAINVDPITISTTTSNLNNNLNYINGITDQRHTLAYDIPNITLPDTEISSVLELKPGTDQEQVQIPLISNPNVQLKESSIAIKTDVQKIPNLEPQNMILRKTTTAPINVVVTIPQTNDPKISNDEYVTYPQNIPEQTFRNTDSVNEAVDNESDISLTLTPVQINGATEMNPNLEYAYDIKDAVSPKLNDENILMNSIKSNSIVEVNGQPEINKENKMVLETNAIDEQIFNGNSNFTTIDNNLNKNQSTDDIVVFAAPSILTSRKLDIEQGNLIPDTITNQVNKDIERTFSEESETIKNKENDVSSYVNYIDSNLDEPNSPLVVDEEDKINAPKLNAKENDKAQYPYYKNIDSLVNSNHNNIPTHSTNKIVPQIYVRNHNNYGNHVNEPPYNYMNYQLIQNKPQLHHHHHPWNVLQNGVVLMQNQSRFLSLDQPYIFYVREQWPYHFSQPISVTHGRNDLQGKEQYSHGLTKPNINQNLYTPDPVKNMLNPNILKPLPSKEPVTNPKAESILDLSQTNLDDKYYYQPNPQEVITTQFREESPPKNLNSWKNYDDFIINLPDEGKQDPENYTDYNNDPFKYNDISSPITFLSYYPYTGKHFNSINQNIGSNIYHMLDPCTYKNILALEGHVNPTAKTTISRELTDKGDNLSVDYNAPPSQPNSFGVFVPTYDHLHIPASISSKLNTIVPPINPYCNKYFSILSQIGNKLTPLTSKKDVSNKDQYDLSNFKKPMLTIENDELKTEESRTLIINDIENNVLHKGSLVEPINNVPEIPECIRQMPKSVPLNKLALSSSPLLYRPYLNQKPLVTNNHFRTPSYFHSHLKELKGFLQPEKITNKGPYQYSTIASTTQPLAHDITVTGLRNNDNSNSMILNNALLQNVSPTVLNPYHKKVENSLPKCIYPTITFTSVQINPLKDTTTISHTDSSNNFLLPCSVPGFIEQKLYPSEAQFLLKSTDLIPLKVEPITTDTQTSATHSQIPSNLEPLTSKAVQNKNVLAPSSVLPLSTLIQDTPLSSVPSYKSIPLLKAFLPSKQYKTEPSLLEEGNMLNSNEPSPCFSKSITPIQPFTSSSNYVTVPHTTTSFIPHYYNSKIPLYKASPQNVVTYVNKFPSNSFSSAPELSVLLPSMKTQDTKSFSDTPFNAELSSVTQPQNAISFVPNSYKTDPSPLYGDQYSTSKPIGTNILKPQRYSEFFPTLSSIEKPISFKSNLDTKLKHSPQYNIPSFAKPNTLSDQEFQKFLTPIQNLESPSPDLVSLTKYDEMPLSYNTADLKPLVFSQNYLLAPRFTNSNIDSWKHLNNDTLPKTQSWSKTVSPRVDKAIALPVQGHAESVLLPISKTLSLPMRNLNPSNLNPSLSTRYNPRVQSYQLTKNQANLIPHNTISPYTYTLGPSQNKVTWNPPCASHKESNQQVNGINNNIASIYQIPTVKSGFWSKEFPFRYAGYRLSTEIPKYEGSSQLTYLEPKPFNKIATKHSLVKVSQLELQPTIPTISKLSLQGPAIPVPNQRKQIKPMSNDARTSFLESKTPKIASYHILIPNSSSHLENEVSSTQSNLNKMTNPFATSNTVIPSFDTSSSSSALSPLQENKLLPKSVTEIPFTQGAPSDLAVSPSLISVLPVNPFLQSISFEDTPKPASNLPVNSLPSDFHSHDSSSLNSDSNNLNTLWSYLLPFSQVSNSKDQKPLLRNLIPLSPFHTDVTSTPVIGRAPTYSNTASSSNEIPASVLTTELPHSKSISKPILRTQYLSPCFHELPAKINFVPKTTKIPLGSSSLAYHTYPSMSINDNINMNKPNLNLPKLQGTQRIISTLLNPKTSNLSPKTITVWANQDTNSKFTPPCLSSDPVYVSFHSEPQQSIHDLPISSSSSMKVSYQSARDYSPGSPTSQPSRSICSPSGPLPWKTLATCIHKPDLTHDANTRSTPSTIYASSIPHTHIPTLGEKILDEAQLKPKNNFASLSSTYFPYHYGAFSTEKEIYPLNNDNQYATPLNYDHFHQSNIITTPSIRKYLPKAYTCSQPYFKTLEKPYDGNIEQLNVKIINQMNNNLKDYVEKSDVKNNILNEKVTEIPLNNIGVVLCEPMQFCNISYLKTDNPDIYLKVWPTLVKIVKPKVVLEIGKLEALNFCPIIKDEKTPFTNDEVQKLVEVFVKKYYGEPIIVKTENNSHKPRVVVDNIDESCIKNGKAYIVWANVCDCGCNRMGCHCINSNANFG